MDPTMGRLSQKSDPTSSTQTELRGEDTQGAIMTSNKEETVISDEMEAQPVQEGDDEASRLRNLATDVRDQDDLERAIGRQV